MDLASKAIVWILLDQSVSQQISIRHLLCQTIVLGTVDTAVNQVNRKLTFYLGRRPTIYIKKTILGLDKYFEKKLSKKK